MGNILCNQQEKGQNKISFDDLNKMQLNHRKS